MLLVSGCGVSYDGVDVMTTPPDGLWQTLAVWPLTKALIWLNDVLATMSIPYSWGFAIILFTVIIKLVTFPLTMSQIRGMQAQKELQPRLQEIQKKYGKDREKLAQEQMALYKEAGVNPLSGCLPLLIQMPILFGLYAALVALGPRLNDAHFFWIPNLAFPSFTGGLAWIPDLFTEGQYGVLLAYLILPVLLMVSQIYVQKYMTPATPSTGNDGTANMMKQMTTIMTLMFGFFTLQVPAGLTLYWVTSNFLQMGQQFLVTRITSPSGSNGQTSVLQTSGPATAQGTSGTNGTKDGTTKDGTTKPTTVTESQSLSKRSRRQRKRK
jgi:YidC/Oxa1 family membrane protein insertase